MSVKNRKTGKTVMKYKAVVFDMDGVIFDSERLVLECWTEVAEKMGIRDMDKVYYQCIGVNMAQSKEITMKYYGPEFPYDTFRAEASRLYHTRFDNGRLPMKPGVTELLKFLKENGYAVGLASSTRYEVVHQEIADAGLLTYFQTLTCGDMVKVSKPNPEIFLKACEALKVAPEEAIAIEDSFNGIRAAYRAGMFPVMVPDMVQPDAEMEELAGAIFKDLGQVREWLATGSIYCISS